jgi:NADH:ubiquinone oxidoreductase subunit H
VNYVDARPQVPSDRRDFSLGELEPKLLHGVKQQPGLRARGDDSPKKRARFSPHGAPHSIVFGAMQRGLPPRLFRRTSRRAAGLWLTVASACGCQRTEAPELLSVHRLEPARAAAGDRLIVTGEGFPEGRPATLTFRGDLYRSGLAPERDVRIVVHAVQSARNALVVPLDSALERRFVRGGHDAPHTTFRGTVRVTFEPGPSGLTEISGAARDVRFDVVPALPRGPAAETEVPSPPAFLGMIARAEPSGAGLRVTAVSPDGRAARAGLRAEDVLLDFDGLTVLSGADLSARGGQQTAEVIVEREGRELPPLAVDVEGMAPLGPTDLAAPAGVLVVVSAILGLLATRLATALRWAPYAAEASAGKGSARQPPRRGMAAAIEAIVLPIADARGLSGAALLIFGFVVVGLVRLATGHSVFSPDLDVVVAAFSVSVALLCARFADGGVGLDGEWSLGRALAAFGATLACVLPAILAIGGSILASGRFVISEMVADQGAPPWRWAAARNPGLAGLVFVLFATATLETGDRSVLSAVGLPASDGRRTSGSRLFVRLAEWTYLWVMSSLSVALLLGGWRLPGVPSLVQETSRALSAAGAAVLVLKVGLVVLAIGAARAGLSRVLVEHAAPLWIRWALPATLLAAALAAGWATALEGVRSGGVADFCGYLATTLAALLVTYLTLATARARHSPAGAAGVNPWL